MIEQGLEEGWSVRNNLESTFSKIERKNERNWKVQALVLEDRELEAAFL